MDQQGNGQAPGMGVVGSATQMPYIVMPYQANQITSSGTTTPPPQAAGVSASPAQTAQNQLAYQQMHQQQQQQLQQQQPIKTCVLKVNIHSDGWKNKIKKILHKIEGVYLQTCVFKVHIHSDGCKNNIKKILQKIEGVYNVKIDSDQGTFTVSGNFDPVSLVEKLTKKGKCLVEIMSIASDNHHLNNQFKNLQIDHGKGGNNNNKGQGGQKGDVGNQPKGGGDPQGQNRPNPHLQQMKCMQDPMMVPQFMKDMKMPIGGNNNKGAQNPKAVKFNLPEDEGFSSDEFGDDDNYDDDDKFDDDLCDAPLNKMKSMMCNGQGGGGPPQMMPNTMNMIMKGGGSGGNSGNIGGNANDGPHGVPNRMAMNGRVPIGNIGNPQEGHMANLTAVQGLLASSMNGDGGGLGYIQGGGPKRMNDGPHGVPNMMAMNGRVPIGNIGNPQEGHMAHLTAVQGLLASSISGCGGGLGYIQGGGPKRMNDGPNGVPNMMAMNGRVPIGNIGNPQEGHMANLTAVQGVLASSMSGCGGLGYIQGGGPRRMNNGIHGVLNMMGLNGRVPIGNIGNPQEGHMFSLAAVQGLLVSSMNRGGGGLGYIEGGGPEPMAGSPYLQELANSMMNQQRANGNERFQPMMYARPPPDVNYMPPYSLYLYRPPPGYWANQY